MTTKDLGMVTAYAYAVAGGYTGTEAQFEQLMADLADEVSRIENLSVTVVTLPAGSQATASLNGSVLSLGIPKGDKGDKGEQGPQGIQGEVGPQGPKGDTGETGAPPNFSIGEVDTLEPNESATATITGTAENPVLNLGIPKGEQGDVSRAELDRTVTDLKSDLSDTEEWLGYPKNLFDARAFEITNTSNWSIDSATKTAITITHKTTYSTGQPIALLSLPSGDYVFHADYSQSPIKLSLKQGDTWFGELTDGVEFTIDDTIENKIYFSSSVVATYTITDISISLKTVTGKIPNLESVTQQLESTVAEHDADIDDLTTGFAQITDPVISSIDGTETQNQIISSTGSLATAGTDNYRTIRYAVTVGKKYYINASTNYGNRLWCFYDSNNNVVELGTRSETGSAFTDITDVEVTAPTNASYLVIAYHSQHTLGDVKTQTGLTVAKKWVGKKWVCVGDSLTAINDRTTKHYFDYVADATGITTVNMGDSGSGYAREQDVGTAFYQRIGDCPTDADVVTIFGSFNDLGAGLPIGSVDDTGTTTLAGCINTTIDNLQAVLPLVNLGIVAPTPWDTTQPTTSGQAYNYVEMLKAICERRSIPFLDLWRGSNLRPWDADFRELAYSKDGGSGTHPDETGHKIIAPRFKGFLETLLM